MQSKERIKEIRISQTEIEIERTILVWIIATAIIFILSILVVVW